MKSWQDAHQHLGNRSIKNVAGKKITYVVRISDDEGAPIRVMYGDVPIITYFANGSIKLRSGGHYGRTTKDRLNEFTPFYVQQVKGVWFVSIGRANGDDITVPFKDGMTITVNGMVENGLTLDDLAKRNELRDAIRDYAQAWAEKFVEGELANGNDKCFECQAATGGHPSNDAVFTGDDHYRKHIETKHYSGLLAIAAFHATRTNHIYLAAAESFLRGSKSEPQSREMYVREYSKMVYRFLCDKLGVAG